MHIERVQVEEGFLDGLDVSFTAGLNVIIGARGTGKTSLIELIRFCLDVGNNTADSARRSKDHALSILGAGQVTITLANGDHQITVTRTANDPAPRATAAYTGPVIFSQTEIETVGLEAAGRLRLLDGFVTSSSSDSEERETIFACRSLTQQVEVLRREIDEIEQQLILLPTLNEDLRSVIVAEQEVSKTSILLQTKAQELGKQSESISRTGVFVEQVGRLKNDVAAWSHDVKRAIDSSPVYSLSLDTQQAATISPFLDKTRNVFERLKLELGEVLDIYNELNSLFESSSKGKIELEDVTRQLRKEVESIQSGSGGILRRGQELREKIAKLNSLADYLKEKRKILDDALKKRSSALDTLDRVRQERFEKRLIAASWLNSIVGPNIKISLLRNGQAKTFGAAIAEALRGSGLRYADIAEALSSQISPRALLDAVDSFDVELISDAAKISPDRASKILLHLKDCELGEISTVRVEDEVSLQLLDGRDYKDISELSTGQRCTVVLPLVLAHMNRMLIVDQPEDHIDNAFIAETLIKVILSRGEQGQIIFSTHNPNIPVLGDADTVVHLGSDGRRGFKLSVGELHEEKIVHAITAVMEGGATAFAKRADFYGEHLDIDA